jgi:hypothetical protein
MGHHFELPKLALLAGIAVSALVHGQTDVPNFGDVTFEFVGPDGGPPGVGTLEIYSVDGGKIIEQHVEAEATFRLSYGKHLVNFIAQSSVGERRYVTVDEPKSFVVIPWRVENFVTDYSFPTPHELQIAVKPATSCAPGGSLWAKLVGVYSDYARVGKFESHDLVTLDNLDFFGVKGRKMESEALVTFDSLDYSQYLIMIVDADHLRATQAVTPLGKVTRVNITLPACDQKTNTKP